MIAEPAPLVAAEAARLGVLLNKVQPTGAGGRATVADVRRAAAQNVVVTPGASARPPLTPELIRSPFGRGPVVEVDRFSLRPFVDYVMAAGGPSPYGGSPPEMFSSGPIPPFTSSGLDPALLRWCPWVVRHAAALSSDRAAVFHMCEGLDEPERWQSHEGREQLDNYRSRVWAWATAGPPVDASKQMTGDEYTQFFGARPAWTEAGQ